MDFYFNFVLIPWYKGTGSFMMEGAAQISTGCKERVVEELLDKQVEVVIEDERSFVGIMKCLDYKMNILLTECNEFYKLNGSQVVTKIGIVNIPGSSIKEVRLL